MKKYPPRKKKTFFRNDKAVLTIYLLLRFFVVAVMVSQFSLGNYNNAFLCILTLILFLIPDFAEKKLQIKLPGTLEIIILLFIFSAQILGEIKAYYLSVPYWDSILHTLNGFLMAAIGFAMIDILNRTDKFHMNLSPIFVALFAVCFSVTIGVFWEFFEFGMDCVFKTDMQKDAYIDTVSSVMLNPTGQNSPLVINVNQVSLNNGELVMDKYLDIGLIDTMTDMGVNAVGAVIFSMLGFVYIKNRDKAKFIENFLPQKIQPEPQKSVSRNYRRKKAKK